MRLTKPSLVTSVPVLGEPWSILGTAVQDEMEADIRTPRDLPAFASGELLALPHNFEALALLHSWTYFHIRRNALVGLDRLITERKKKRKQLKTRSQCLIPKSCWLYAADKAVSNDVGCSAGRAMEHTGYSSAR